MIRKFYLSVALLATLPLAAVAGTNSIGTASARGDMRVDNYKVQGNATLFDGSVVQAGTASVDVRMPAGVQIMLAADSQGTLYRDHLVLQSGATTLTSSGSFSLEAKGLKVTSTSPNSHGIVSLRTSGNVEVAALTGSFGVTNSRGVLLANIIPGKALRIPAAMGQTGSTTLSGTLSVNNGVYSITDSAGQTITVQGTNLAQYVGKTLSITATTSTTAGVTTYTVTAVTVAGVAGGVAGAGAGLITGIAIGGAIGVAVAVPVIVSTSNSGTPASP
jgi:hypothetical protein